MNGGAIALGHAVGCTGCRISMTLIREMADGTSATAWRRCALAAVRPWL